MEKETLKKANELSDRITKVKETLDIIKHCTEITLKSALAERFKLGCNVGKTPLDVSVERFKQSLIDIYEDKLKQLELELESL